MKQYFESIFNLGYTQYKGKGTGKGRDVQNSIRELTKNIGSIAVTFRMQAEFSVGIGRWSAVPWIRVYYSDLSPSAQDGVYIVYLFSASGKTAFITLNQGTTDSSMEKRNRTRKMIQEKVNARNFLKNSGDLSFGDNKNYGAAAIFYKEYKAETLPSEEEMIKDLNTLLEIYKECRDKGILSEKIYPDGNKTMQKAEAQRSTSKKIIANESIKEFHISDFEETELTKRYIRSILAKPFVILTGNSGTGKTRIAKRFATYLEKKINNDKNYLLVPVGADWTDNTKILGFFNPLTKEYHSTPVLDFILLAGQNPDIPFFLILDEMNLSHVERYFSDFLSAMESGEPIPLYKNGVDCKSLIPEEIVLPTNLFVTGTVNIDETTYMFSPKVLDRANVIEFHSETNDVIGILASSSENTSFKKSVLGVAEDFMRMANDVKMEPISDGLKKVFDEMKPILESFHGELKKYGFEFAYRTVKEIKLYSIATWLTSEGTKPTETEIVDIQILQKILPKIHGNRKQIGDLLDHLEALCTKYSLDKSLGKIVQMKDKLQRFQYASFI